MTPSEFNALNQLFEPKNGRQPGLDGKLPPDPEYITKQVAAFRATLPGKESLEKALAPAPETSQDLARQIMQKMHDLKKTQGKEPVHSMESFERAIAAQNATLGMCDLLEKYKDFKLEFLWDNFIVKHANNFITAEGGTGKTRLGIALAVSAKYGLNFFLGNRLSVEGNVLYLNFEITEPLFKVIAEPIELYVRSSNPTMWGEVYVMNFVNNPGLTIEDAAHAMKMYNIKLVIIDSFKACVSRLMREKKQRDLTNLNSDIYFDVLNGWREKYNLTTLTINHTNKGLKNQRTSGDLAFGPSSIRDFMDYQVFLRYAYDSERPERLLVVDKARFIEKGHCNKLIKMCTDYRGYFYFDLLEDGIRETDFISDDKPAHEKTDKIIELLDEGKTYKEIRTMLNCSEREIANANKFRKEREKPKEEEEEECPF